MVTDELIDILARPVSWCPGIVLKMDEGVEDTENDHWGRTETW